MCFDSRANINENSNPVTKNGTADARYIAESRRKFAWESSSETGTWSTISRATGIARALTQDSTVSSQRVSNRASHCFLK
jgi:hypothetical protein